MIASSAVASFYQRAFSVLPRALQRRIHPLEFAIQQFVREAADSGSHRKILDAGSGEGRFREFFSREQYLGIDLSIGDRSWDYSSVDAVADLVALPLATGSVDLVLSIQVVEHVPRPEAVLAETRRVLRPEGELYMTVPQGWPEHQQPHDYYRFTRYALRDLLQRTGFSRIRIEPMGGYFHYLAHRLTYIPKVLFQFRPLWLRVLLFPLELIALALFCFLLPILCYYLDPLDKTSEFTLCYRCRATR